MHDKNWRWGWMWKILNFSTILESGIAPESLIVIDRYAHIYRHRCFGDILALADQTLKDFHTYLFLATCTPSQASPQASIIVPECNGHFKTPKDEVYSAFRGWLFCSSLESTTTDGSFWLQHQTPSCSSLQMQSFQLAHKTRGSCEI